MEHSDHTRAEVLAALLEGQSINAIAGKYHMSRETVRRWREQAGMADAPMIDQQKRRDLGDLLGRYLEEVLITLATQARHFRDETWLNKQPAGEAAVLHGVVADKAFRILSALEGVAEVDKPAPPPPD